MKKILIFGAVKHAIEKAKELGYKIVLVDQNPNIDCINQADEFRCISFENYEECLKFAKEQKIDGVMTATDFAVITAGYVAEKLNLPGLSFETAKLAKDKYKIRKKMYENGITNVPQFFEISSLDEIYEIKDKINFPLILKPSSGLGSLHIFLINNFDELIENISEVINGSFNKKALLETFIDGQEYGIESFVYEGKVHILAIMKKNMTKLPYRSELGHSIPSELSIEIENKIKNVVEKLIRVIGIESGPVNMDMILSKQNEVYIVDVGARIGGNGITSHIIPKSKGIDHIGNTIKLAMNEKDIDLNKKYDKCIATRILDLDEGIIEKLPDFEDYFKDKNIIDICFEKKVGDKIERYVSDAQRCGFIVVQGDDIEKAKAKAIEVRDRINNEIIRGGINK